MISFTLARQIPLALSVLLLVGAMLFSRKPDAHWMASISLAGFTGLSTVGIVLNLPLMPIIQASTAALASWDLPLEIHSQISYGASLQNEFYERLHLKSLGAAIGQWIHWQSPL